jgi:hypothetical protein
MTLMLMAIRSKKNNKGYRQEFALDLQRSRLYAKRRMIIMKSAKFVKKEVICCAVTPVLWCFISAAFALRLSRYRKGNGAVRTASQM